MNSITPASSSSLPAELLASTATVPQPFIVSAPGYRSADQIRVRTRRPWLVRRLIRENSFVVVFAPPASYKSFLTQQLAFGIATGTEAWGRPMERGSVIYLSGGEGTDGLRDRAEAWEQGTDLSLVGTKVVFREEPENLRDPQKVSALIGEFRRLLPADAPPLRLVVIDTLSRHFGGGEENSQGPMAEFVEGAQRIQRELRCTVVVVHHTTKSAADVVRGSSVLMGAADTALLVSRERGKTVLVKPVKQKETRTDIALRFKVEEISLGVDEDGEPLNSAHLVYLGDENLSDDPEDKPKPPPLGPVQRVVKKALDERRGEWHTVEDLLAALPGQFEKSRRGRRSLTDALRTLAERGLVEICGEEPEEGDENDERLFRVC
jgi:hypothetical protein